jgi:hypothetical protein
MLKRASKVKWKIKKDHRKPVVFFEL